MFSGIYRDFVRKSECGDCKLTGIACIPAIPVIFEVNQKKKCGLFIYTAKPRDTRPQAARTSQVHVFELGPKKFEMNEFM